MADAKITMLAGYYNMKAQSDEPVINSRFRAIREALEKADGDISTVKAHIDEYVQFVPEDKRSMTKCFKSFNASAPVQSTQPAQVTEQSVGSAMGILEQAVVGLIAKTQSEKIENEIMGNVESTIRDFIKREYGSIERKITTVIDGRKAEVDGVQHEKFETVLKFVANNEPVFLTGPAGSGKNVLCKQIAQALGLKFYFTNAVTQEYKLTGFTDAMGNYQPTQFYKAFTEGGVFMLDEMDASIPEVLVILNAAIANRYFDFPAPIGYVEAHPDFRVIAAGNTTGNGADFEYVGRNQLDAASLDRFAVVKIDYSPTIEMSVAGNDEELVEFCRAFRKEAQRAGCMVIVSYRGIGRLAKMLKIMDLKEAIKTCLVKGLDGDSVRMIAHEMPNSKYKQALESIAKEVA